MLCASLAVIIVADKNVDIDAFFCKNNPFFLFVDKIGAFFYNRKPKVEKRLQDTRF